MSKTARFRKDHESLLETAGELLKFLKPKDLAADAGPCCKLIAKMSGTLKVHLAAEDRSLYPELLNSKDSKIAGIAKKFVDEMGGIKAVVEQYSAKWSKPDNVQKDVMGFINETNGLIKALKERIDKENNVLYDLVDKTAA